jgi:nicotinamide mononucleotide transporter
MSHDGAVTAIEVLGFVAGLACVWLYVRENPLAWPVGIVNSGAWAVLFWDARLFLDAALQLGFVALALWGWWQWLRGGPRHDGLLVRRTTPREAVAFGVVAVAGVAVLTRAMTAVGDAMPFWDAATTTGSLVAQYMLGRKLLGTWWWWIAVDVAYAGIYATQGLWLTAALQPVFVVLCVLGLRAWRASLAAAPAVPVGDPPATAAVTS